MISKEIMCRTYIE